MKPPRFDYYDPRSLEEASELLRLHQGDCRILAGGQSLMPLLNMRLARPKVLLDINRIGALHDVKPWKDGVAVGAVVRQRALETDGLISQRLPLLRTAVEQIGHPQIRSRGTICGSLAHADPAAELPALAVALGAEMVAAGPTGNRTIAADAFYTSYFTTTLAPNEILTEVRFPAPKKEFAWSLQEVSRRHGDFALVGIVAGIEVDSARRSIREARLVYFGVGPTPVRVKEAENVLAGQPPGAAAFQAAAEKASRELDPSSDIHASAAYRRSVAGALTRRALAQVWQKLGGN